MTLDALILLSPAILVAILLFSKDSGILGRVLARRQVIAPPPRRQTTPMQGLRKSRASTLLDGARTCTPEYLPAANSAEPAKRLEPTFAKEASRPLLQGNSHEES